jgi:hypothetical protein
MMQEVHTRETEFRIAMAKAAFNKKSLLTNKMHLNLRKKPVKCYIWSRALYSAETWTLREVDQIYLESFKMWYWRRMKKISCTDRVKKRKYLHRVKKERNIIIQ